MKKAEFKQASAVQFPFGSPEESARVRKEEAVSQFGFYTALDLSDREEYDPVFDEAVLRITARHVYRLYINGEIVMHGPARTAHGYARVDEMDVSALLVRGLNHIAVEVMTYGDTYAGYSNDMTLNDGDGFLICELESDGTVLTATGDGTWGVCRVAARVRRTARLSHCREASEIYRLDDEYYLWRMGWLSEGHTFLAPAPAEAPVFLAHEALLPTLEDHPFTTLLDYGTCRLDDRTVTPLFFENNPNYCPAGFWETLTEHPLNDCRRTVDEKSAKLTATRDAEGITLSGADDTYVLLDGGESFVGFPSVSVFCEKPGIIDIVHTELLGLDGSVTYDHNVVERLHVPAGLCEFTAMEPGLGRWIKVYFRGTGEVTIHSVSMKEYSYPDEQRGGFLCSDEDVNRVYKAARRTLLLNTLDIFMDCPDRERGGWLCDSLWTSRAAALLLSDTRVEREFLENFLLTPADGMFRGFFPEAYPGNKLSYKDMTGITTWTFWLMCEVCEYVGRTGDTAFRDEYAGRVAAFVEGSKTFLGKSGLLENLPWLFIDWSMSNYAEYQQPISVPANALYAYMLQKLGEVFGRPEWIAEGKRVRTILREAVAGKDARNAVHVTSIPDSLVCDGEGRLQGRGRVSETALVTTLWSGLFEPGEVPELDRLLRDTMGPAPTYPANPEIGQSQLFIGLCIRLDVLTRRGHFDQMFRDLKAIYLPQLREGPGTLWEATGMSTSSRCHGFTSHAGVHLTRDVLGMPLPDMTDRTLTIAPHICGLRWARGSQELPEGIMTLSWRYDGESFTLEGSVPAGYTLRVELPRETRMLDADKVHVNIVTV
ncbi:MAG: hypothetical protein MJ192_06210 [Clostridia bacterium]|nr:hypothetical protein [Clostridia bacterium]